MRMEGDGAVQVSEPVRLRRQLHLYHGIGVITGLVIGTGIYMTPQEVFIKTGSPGLCLVIWVVAGLLEILGGLCLAELGTLFPQSGERFVYMEKLYGPCGAFVYLLTYLITIRNAGNALKVLLLARSVLKLIYGDCDIPETPVKLIAIAVAGGLTLLNIVAVKVSVNTQTILTSTGILGLALISVTGIVHIGQGNAEYLGFDGTTPKALDIAVAISTAIFSYGGWNALNFLVEELKKPEINLPLSIVISQLLIIVLYVLTNMAYLSVLSPEEMITSPSVAVSFGVKTLGVMAWIIPLFIALNAMGSWNSGIMVGSRLCFAGARRGHLPDLLALIHVKYFSPITALIFQFVCQCVYIAWGDFMSILRNVTFTNILFNVLCIIGLLRLRRTHPDLPRPLRVPAWVAVVYILSNIFLLVMQLIRYPLATGLGVILVIGISLPLYVFFVLPDKMPFFITSKTRRLTIWCQKLLMCCPQDNMNHNE